jgi:hypothetical protein
MNFSGEEAKNLLSGFFHGSPWAAKQPPGAKSPVIVVVAMAQPPEPIPDSPDPTADPLATESPDGVDLTLIHWTLSLTPLERIELLQDWVDGLAELRGGRTTKR